MATLESISALLTSLMGKVDSQQEQLATLRTHTDEAVKALRMELHDASQSMPPLSPVHKSSHPQTNTHAILSPSSPVSFSVKAEASSILPVSGIHHSDSAHDSSPSSSSSLSSLKPISVTFPSKGYLLPSTGGLTEFKAWKAKTRTYLGQFALRPYIDRPLGEVVKLMEAQYRGVPIDKLEPLARTQSAMLACSLLTALGSHAREVLHRASTIPHDPKVHPEDDCHLVWSAACQLFENKTMYTNSMCIAQLSTLRYKYGDDPSIVYRQLLELNEQLTLAGIGFTDAVLAAYLVNALPSELSALKQTLFVQASLTVEQVLGSLRQSYEEYRSRHPSKPKPNSSDSALVAEMCDHDDHADSALVSAPTKPHASSKSKQKKSNARSKPPRPRSNSNASDDETDRDANAPIVTAIAREIAVPTSNSFSALSDDGGEDHAYVAGDRDDQSEHGVVWISNPYDFILDSAATRHMLANRDLLREAYSGPALEIMTFSTRRLRVKEYGYVKMNAKLRLGNVAFVPGSTSNLVSVSTLQKNGVEVRFMKNRADLIWKAKNMLLLSFQLVRGLYVYRHPNCPPDQQSHEPVKVFEHQRKIPLKPKGVNNAASSSSSSSASTAPRSSPSAPSTTSSSSSGSSARPTGPAASSGQRGQRA